MTGSKACALLLAASLVGCGTVFCDDVTVAEEQPSAAQMMDDLMYGHGSVGGPFTLTDQTGKPRSDTDFRGKLMIVYFGYTYCPDVCPTDLMAITQALDALGPAATEVQPIFITIDPERDTPLLADYIAAFHRSFVGLTGSAQQIRTVANAYKAFYVKVQDARSGDYSIDHAGVIYLMGRNGEYLGFMPPQTNPDRLTEILRNHLAKPDLAKSK
jgi:cytochrome oxidase Cu insertion factor (SCO1/SenC/PrrC family)